MLQEGIYYDKGHRPPVCFSIMFLRARHGAKAGDVGRRLADLYEMYAALKLGRITDLPDVDLTIPPRSRPRGRRAKPKGSDTGLTILLGYGVKAFALDGRRRDVPQDLQVAQFRSPRPDGGLILPSSRLPYVPGLARNAATEEVMVQAIANTPLAANRAIVETAKLLSDDVHPDGPTLELASAFTGFNREDGRSWIDFHDGVSNLRSGKERLAAIGVKPVGAGTDDWTVGGTYLAFLRVHVDLLAWRKLTVAQQIAAVGRDKITGCPVLKIDGGVGSIDQACPAEGTGSIMDLGNEAFREPPRAAEGSAVALSHVQRANQGGPIEKDSSRRIFRQGYEFLNPPAPGVPMSLGLNFVSFQDTPERLIGMIKTPGWFGDANFGGAEALMPAGGLSLLTIEAAGFFICPPIADGEEFPGQGIFYESAIA